jgi:hypothetical protein
VTDAVTYVYAVTRGADETSVADLAGVGGGPVRLVASGPLQAVVGDVDREEFEARALEERLEDLEWLAATARAHHHVVDAVGRAHVVAPLSLATVYYGDDRVREVLEQGGETFRAVLDRLTGRAEWGVKAYARDRPVAPAAGSGGERPRSGAEYLRRRRRELREGDLTLEEAQQAAEEVHATVGALAEATRTHRLQDPALTGSTERMVLNGAYLVPVEAVGDLQALVDSLAEHPRLRVELTGPWVPYSFAQVNVS